MCERAMSDRRDARKAEEHRSPPNNLEAEQALLGALLVNNEAIHLVATFLEAPHFFLPVHGRIYDAAMHFVGRREIANPVTLRAYFENDEALNEAGGAQYLARLAGSAVTVINAGHYGRAVHDLYLRRQLIFYAEDVSDAAFDAPLDQPPREQVERAEAKFHEILKDAPETARSAARSARQRTKLSRPSREPAKPTANFWGSLWASGSSKISSAASRHPTTSSLARAGSSAETGSIS